MFLAALKPLDAFIIVFYLAAVVAAGIYARGRQRTADDYFTASGGMSSLFGSILVGLSIAATLFSGISFLSYPSVVYSAGLVLVIGVSVICMPAAWIVLKFWFLPRYLSLGYRHPYDVIEHRFGPVTRTTAAAMFVLVRVGWMAALIYAPTLAILGAAGLTDAWFWPLVLTIGFSSTLYTVFSGIRGVIVTDAIQFCVIAAGIALTIGYILWNMPVSIGEAVASLEQTGRLHWLDLSLDMTAMTFWAVAIGVTVANMSNYVADQMSLQRYLATGNVHAAARSFGINVIGVIFIITLLGTVGLALAVWYMHVPDAGLPEQTDRIFPYFIATRLPVGVGGLLLAAILAATMSSMTSGINALAATITLDFRVRFGSAITPERQLRFARLTSLITGIAATIVAGMVSKLGTLFELTQIILGVFMGPLLVCVSLAVVRWALNGGALVAGMILGCIVGWIIALSPWSALWVAPGSALVTFIVAIVFTAILGPGRRSAVPGQEREYADVNPQSIQS